MNSNSTWIGPNEQTELAGLNSQQPTSEQKREDCLDRVRKIETALQTVSLPAKLKPVALRRLQTAQRFLRSDELGGCNYELRILELMIEQCKS